MLHMTREVLFTHWYLQWESTIDGRDSKGNTVSKLLACARVTSRSTLCLYFIYLFILVPLKFWCTNKASALWRIRCDEPVLLIKSYYLKFLIFILLSEKEIVYPEVNICINWPIFASFCKCWARGRLTKQWHCDMLNMSIRKKKIFFFLAFLKPSNFLDNSMIIDWSFGPTLNYLGQGRPSASFLQDLPCLWGYFKPCFSSLIHWVSSWPW